MKLTTTRLEKSEQVATITLNRPDHMNTINAVMLNELVSHFEDVSLDEEIRVVIFTGEGRAFSAGADITDIDEFLGL